MDCFGVSQDTSDYQARHRSLELNIENRTEHRLEFQGDYFESGVWFSNPGYHVLESQGYRRLIVTSQGGGFLRVVTGVMKYRVVDDDCFLYLCFPAPAVGAYKNQVSLHGRDYAAGTEHGNLQGDRFTAVKFGDLVASVEMLESSCGCKMQFLYRLTEQKPLDLAGQVTAEEDLPDGHAPAFNRHRAVKAQKKYVCCTNTTDFISVFSFSFLCSLCLSLPLLYFTLFPPPFFSVSFPSSLSFLYHIFLSNIFFLALYNTVVLPSLCMGIPLQALLKLKLGLWTSWMIYIQLNPIFHRGGGG